MLTYILISQISLLIPLIKIAPELIGINGKKTYLLLFQNNTELRPGGGFIGAYGLVSFDKGKIGQITIQNTYDADGQLKKHIEPYFIERRYIQVHLYMRDSNFDVDFLKSAQKVAYMLKEETGQHVDGVIAIDFSFVRNLIKVISPIYLWQYNQNISDNNLFITTETHTDKNSFYGSTQKQDFLRALLSEVKSKVESNKIIYAIKFLQITKDAIEQKHLLIALFNPKLQSDLTKNHLSSSLWDTRKNDPETINDFLGINEANIGANKANYFLTRTIKHITVINRQGKISETLNITYKNNTTSNSWPSGTYKNYIRLILPLKTTLQSISIDNNKQKIIPAITDFHKYEAPGFHPPEGLEVDQAEEEKKTIYGFIITVGIKTTKTITIAYQLANPVNINNVIRKYNLYVFKQPGINEDSYSFSLIYPTTHKTQTNGTPAIKLSTDKDIAIDLSK